MKSLMGKLKAGMRNGRSACRRMGNEKGIRKRTCKVERPTNDIEKVYDIHRYGLSVDGFAHKASVVTSARLRFGHCSHWCEKQLLAKYSCCKGHEGGGGGA